jgi:hypothetical protein
LRQLTHNRWTSGHLLSSDLRQGPMPQPVPSERYDRVCRQVPSGQRHRRRYRPVRLLPVLMHQLLLPHRKFCIHISRRFGCHEQRWKHDWLSRISRCDWRQQRVLWCLIHCFCDRVFLFEGCGGPPSARRHQRRHSGSCRHGVCVVREEW